MSNGFTGFIRRLSSSVLSVEFSAKWRGCNVTFYVSSSLASWLLWRESIRMTSCSVSTVFRAPYMLWRELCTVPGSLDGSSVLPWSYI